MSYDIQLYRIETRDRHKQLKDENFFDKEENLEPFTEEQFNALRRRLLIYDYIEEANRGNEIGFRHPKHDIRVLLTQRGLYFTAGWKRNTIFEAGMTASEFTDSDEFAKYDPQNEGWEEL